MIVNYNSNTLVFQLESDTSYTYIHLEYRILAFCINVRYIAVLEDWEHLNSYENLHIYDISGKFLFNVKPAPRALYNDGYYSSIGFDSPNVLIACSNDYSYKIDLISMEFIEEKFTK